MYSYCHDSAYSRFFPWLLMIPFYYLGWTSSRQCYYQMFLSSSWFIFFSIHEILISYFSYTILGMSQRWSITLETVNMMRFLSAAKDLSLNGQASGSRHSGLLLVMIQFLPTTWIKSSMLLVRIYIFKKCVSSLRLLYMIIFISISNWSSFVQNFRTQVSLRLAT